MANSITSVAVAEIGIGPGLRHAPPVLGPSEEVADLRLLADGSAPLLLVREEMRDHGVVLDGLRVLGVEADLDREHGRALVGVRPDHLRLVVLARRRRRTEPDLHAVAVRAEVVLAQLGRRQASQRVADFVEQ